jgi:hypothetical protein
MEFTGLNKVVKLFNANNEETRLQLFAFGCGIGHYW